MTASELRRFGLLVGGVFGLGLGLAIPFLLHQPYPRWPWFVAVPLLGFAAVYPPALRVLYRLWTWLGQILNWINTRIILSVLFFLFFTPIGLVMKVLGKDPLWRCFDKKLPSYRTPSHETPAGQMERPF